MVSVVRVQKMPLWLVFKHIHSPSLRSPSLPGWWSPKRGSVLLCGRLVETAVDEVPRERRTGQFQISEGIPQTFRTHHEEKRVNLSLSQTFRSFYAPTYIRTYKKRKKRRKKEKIL